MHARTQESCGLIRSQRSRNGGSKSQQIEVRFRTREPIACGKLSGPQLTRGHITIRKAERLLIEACNQWRNSMGSGLGGWTIEEVRPKSDSNRPNAKYSASGHPRSQETLAQQGEPAGHPRRGVPSPECVVHEAQCRR